jgi:Rrf2 family protein
MKITAQEEYGLRVLLRVAGCQDPEGMSIPQLSEAEGISPHYVAKLTRQLRMAGFINSTPGYKGGYILALPADKIVINAVLKSLGGALYDKQFCGSHSGVLNLCVNSVDCSSRSLWKMIQFTVDQLLDKITVADLIKSDTSSQRLQDLLIENTPGIL